MSMSLGSVGVLGPIEAWSVDGQRLPLGPLRHRAILAVFALRANTPVRLDTLVDVLWGDDPPRTARKLVHTYVSRLRCVIQPDTARWERNGVLSNSSAGYVLSLPDCALDAKRFEAHVSQASTAQGNGRVEEARDLLGAALNMWRGEALAGVSSPLVEAERRWLEERRLLANQDRLALDLELGRHQAVVPELAELAAEHPLRERVLELFMLALYRGGRQSEALEAYGAIRTRLADDLGVEPGAALQSLYVKILRADPLLDSPAHAGAVTTLIRDPRAGRLSDDEPIVIDPAARSPWSAPAQLPRDVAAYTGREKLADELIGQLSRADGHVPVCALAGRPGVGKTALAVHVGHQVRAFFPDGQIFVNLGGVQATPMSQAEALDTMIRAILPQVAELPDTVEERAALFRSLTADRRLLVVLDDVRDSQQIGQLLPAGPGCAVMVTSRSPLVDLDDVCQVRLDSLDPWDGMRMLRRAVGDERVDQEPAAAASIVEACSGLPLAIQIVGSKLAARPYRALRQIAEILGDEARRLDRLASPDRAVRGSIEMTVNLLGSAEREALMLLSLADLQSIDLGGATALLGVDAAAAADLVKTLIDSQLLDTVQHGPTGELAVSFHDLVRLFARERAAREITPQRRRDAIQRLLHRYLGLLEIADTHLPLTSEALGPKADREPHDAALGAWVREHSATWLDTEAPRMTALIRQAAALRLNGLPWLVLDKLLGYTLLRSRWGIWQGIDMLALACARRGADALGEAVLLRALGRIEIDRSDGRVGEAKVQAALELFRSLGHVRGQARALKELSLRASLLGDVERGRKHGEEAIRLASVAGDRTCLADALGQRAIMIWKTGDQAGGLDAATQARALYLELGKPRDVAATNLAIAKCQEMVGNRAAALAALRESLTIVDRIGDVRGQACVLRDLGFLEVADPTHDRIGYLQRSRALCEQLRTDRIRGQVLYGLGRIHQERGDAVAAWDHYRQAWDAIRDYRGAVLFDDIAEAAAGPPPPGGPLARETGLAFTWG